MNFNISNIKYMLIAQNIVKTLIFFNILIINIEFFIIYLNNVQARIRLLNIYILHSV